MGGEDYMILVTLVLSPRFIEQNDVNDGQVLHLGVCADAIASMLSTSH